jgi:hypothetical protein
MNVSFPFPFSSCAAAFDGAAATGFKKFALQDEMPD